MGPFDHPTPCPDAEFPDVLLRLATRADRGRESQAADQFPYFVKVIAFVQAQSLWPFRARRFAPATSMANGMPLASVSRLRLVPPLPRSVGWGSVFFPAQRRLGHRAIQSQPAPVDPLEPVVGQQAIAPEVLKDPGIPPFGKPPIS